MKLIGGDELIAAAEAHIDRTQLFGPRPISRIVESVGVDSEEFLALTRVLVDLREPTNRGEFAAGFIDGLVIGVRAARQVDNA